MKCPNCGAEIPEGCLLCEKCGAEIRIVPDFDTEVENSIAETLSNVAVNLGTSDQEEEEDIPDQKNRRFLRFSTVLVLVLIVITMILSLTAYFGSSNYQITQAVHEAQNQNYQKALAHLEKAKSLGGNAVQISFLMADYYQKEGKDADFINTLMTIMDQDGATDEEIAKAYELLVNNYAGKKQYEAINSLMQGCEYPDIRSAYTQYIADPPEFNYVEGSYNEVIPLKILANTTGHIYYTMDGSKPTTSSKEYTSPVFLDTGNYVITAFFINDYGVVSPLSKSEYHVDVSAPPAPEVDQYSGEFYTPQLIHAEAADNCSIYYTTDGSDPTVDSTLYNGFLPMPMGVHTLKFIAIDENQVASEITVRNYDLELMTDYTKDDAQTVLLTYQVDQGVIQDKTGILSDGSGDRLSYSFACCVTIQDQGDFFIFSEYLFHADGTKDKTGNYYAVGIYNLPLYATQYDAKTGTFALSSPQLNDNTEELQRAQSDH